MLAPVIIFAYKRLGLLQKTLGSLLNCRYSDQSEVFIFCDGPKTEKELSAVSEVRAYLKNLNGFKKIELIFSDRNKGLAESIIQGVSKIHETYNSVIVLEDDLVVSENFLVYMNTALEFYKSNKKIFSISGYSMPIIADVNYKYDVYFTPRASSWGWASWKDRWQIVDWNVQDFNEFKKNRRQIKAFNKGGSDMFNMLNKKMKGKIDSWAIRWCYGQFKANMLTVYPVLSKVQNIGFDAVATNTNVYNKYHTKLDNGFSTNFKFPKELISEDHISKQFLNFYSIKNRILGRVKTYIHKAGLLPNR